jgi:hypothetical protein
LDPKEPDDLLIAPEEDEKANATPPLPENPGKSLVSAEDLPCTPIPRRSSVRRVGFIGKSGA